MWEMVSKLKDWFVPKFLINKILYPSYLIKKLITYRESIDFRILYRL